MYRNNNNYNSYYLKDYGQYPFVININEATKRNNNFRTALWTGEHLQITLMSLNVGESIGLEMHPNVDQFIRIEQGVGLIEMGDTRNSFNFQNKVFDDFALVILSITTGKGTSYGILVISMLTLLAGGMYLIKKYVLRY